MLVQIFSAKCVGINAVPVTVEINVTPGIGIHLVGLADIAVKESLLRTTTALQSLGFNIPGKRIIINLAPADLHKCGTAYDLPIALAILTATGQKTFPNIEKYLIMGELGLDGSIRGIPGAIPYAEMAEQNGYSGIILPLESALEATEFKNINVFGARTLTEVIQILEENEDCSEYLIWNTMEFRKVNRERHHAHPDEPEVDFSEIIGQEGAKRAMEIAVAGNHNLLFVGAPGSGKSSLAKAMPGIMPPMSKSESILTSKVYSIAGKGNLRCGLIRTRPFRSPHYSASMMALLGGGGGDNILPGEVSLAQNGVLFCDEIGQMPKSTIESLRGPLEDRKVTISRLRSKVEYPASFMFVAASNPCPCGWWGESDRCTCTPTQRQAYLSKLSGPILDRIDLQCRTRSISSEELSAYRNSGKRGESSSEVAARILKARIIQKHRFAQDPILTNAEMNNKLIEKYCKLSETCNETMIKIMDSLGLSMRAYFRIIKVARTIADLGGYDDILPSHLTEAASYRFLDRQKEI